MEHGFLKKVTLGAVRNSAHVRAALALIGSSAGCLVDQLRVERSGGEVALRGLSRLRAPSLARIRIHASGGPDGVLDLRGLPALVSLHLRGAGLEELQIRSPSLRSLTVELPFLREAELGEPLASVEAPLLRSLSVTWHRAPDTEAFAALERALKACPLLENLHLRPLSTDALDALLDSELLARVRRVRLDSLFGAAVRRLLDRAGRVAHLEEIRLSVLDVDKAGRRVLGAELAARSAAATLKGISYRPEGGYG
jgi:hypothetical protein